MSISYDGKTGRWLVRCDAHDCPSEYGCSGAFVKADRGYIKKALASLGWTTVPTSERFPRFICQYHKL